MCAQFANLLSLISPLIKRDRKKKKFVQPGADAPKLKKIKTESGNWINASYKSGLYEKWKQRSKIDHQHDTADDDNEEGEGEIAKLQQERNRNIEHLKRHIKQPKMKRAPKRELKTKEEIFKVRSKVEKQQAFQKWKQTERQKMGRGKNNSNTNNKRKGKRKSF